MKLLTKLKSFATRSNTVKAAAIGVFMLGGVMFALPTSTSAATGCDALGVGGKIFTNSTNNTAYTIKNGKATVKFKVSGHNCKLPVSIIAWKAPNGTTGKPYNKQTMFDHHTKTFSEGVHTMTVDLPDCFFQVDTVTGTKLTGSTGGAHDYGHRQVAFMHGGKKSCTPPKPVVAVACTSLTNTPGTVNKTTGAQSFGFTAVATAKNASIVSYTYNFGDGTITTVASATSPNNTTHTYAPGTYKATVTANFKDNGGKALSDTGPECETTVTVKPLPVLTCDSLTATAGAVDSTNGNQTFSFVAKATAKNTPITNYVFNFGDGQSQTVQTSASIANASHTYKPGNFTAVVKVNGTVGGQNCDVPVRVKPLECRPGVPANSPACFEASCNSFTVTTGDDRTVTVSGFDATHTNPAATAANTVINWGDDSDVTSAANVVGSQHQYAQDGTFTITATAHFMVNGVDTPVTGPHCVQQVTFGTPTTPPVVTPPTPETPEVLPNTGAGQVIGLFGAAVVVGTIASRLFMARRLNRQ